MKPILLFLICTCCIPFVHGQDQDSLMRVQDSLIRVQDSLIKAETLHQAQASHQDVIAEGIRLYRCEQATWTASDIFLQKLPEKNDQVGGYFSYPDGANVKTVFFSKANNPTVLTTISFDSSLDEKTAMVDPKERMFTKKERQLYIIRLATYLDIASGNHFYAKYSHTNLNLVPIIDSTSKRVYVMTGLKQSCLVIFGNDYLITFDENNTIYSRQQLHKGITPVECSKEFAYTGEKPAVPSHMHNIETGDLLTATDVCTLLLYQKQAHWKQHVVVSQDNVCIWNCETNEMTLVTKDVWRSTYLNAK